MPEEKNVVLNDEMREKLKAAGVLAFHIDDTFPYVPKAYRENKIPKELCPVFILRGLDGVESANLEDELLDSVKFETSESKETTKVETKMNSGKSRLKTLKMGIVSWRNFRDSKDNFIKKPEEDKTHGGIKESALRVISPKLQVELTNAITEQKTMTDEEMLGLGL